MNTHAAIDKIKWYYVLLHKDIKKSDNFSMLFSKEKLTTCSILFSLIFWVFSGFIFKILIFSARSWALCGSKKYQFSCTKNFAALCLLLAISIGQPQAIASSVDMLSNSYNDVSTYIEQCWYDSITLLKLILPVKWIWFVNS